LGELSEAYRKTYVILVCGNRKGKKRGIREKMGGVLLVEILPRAAANKQKVVDAGSITKPREANSDALSRRGS